MTFRSVTKKTDGRISHFLTQRHLVGVSLVLIAISAEFFFLGKLISGGYREDFLLGVGLSYAFAAILFIWDTLPVTKDFRFRNPLKAVIVFLVAPLAIQLFIPSSLLIYLFKLIFVKPKAKVLKKKAKRKSRLEKLAPLQVGSTVTFTPPNEAPIIGVVRRINLKSTTVISQTDESWRVPHDDSEIIVRAKPAPIKTKSVRKLELVK